jgi:serine/threonine-protein kinase
LEQAVALDPKNASMLVNLASSYMALRKFEAADKTVDRAIAVAPQSFATVGLKAYLAATWRGDLSAAETQFSAIPPEVDPNGLVTWVRSGMLMWQRKFPEALAVVQKFPRETLITYMTAPVPKAFLEGTIHFLEGDKPRAQIEFEKARVVSDKLLRDAPEDPARHAQHGLILAALGQKEEAIKEGKKAVELLPESRDAFDGPQYTAALAQIYAWTGESDEALRSLTRSPKRPRRSNTQDRSNLGSIAERSSLPSADREVRGQALTRGFKIKYEKSLRTEYTGNTGRGVRSTASRLARLRYAGWNFKSAQER